MSNGLGDSGLLDDLVSEVKRMNFPSNKPVFYIEGGWIVRENSDGSKVRIKEYSYRPPQTPPSIK